MSIIKIKLGQREFELSCPEENQDHIYSLADKLNIQIRKFLDTSPSSSFDLAMVITALNLLEAKDNTSKEHLQEDLEDAIKLASEKAANDTKAKFEAENNSLKAQLEAAQAEIEKLESDKSEMAVSDNEAHELYNQLQNLLGKLA